MTRNRVSEILAATPGDRAVVIDIDDDVDAIIVPATVVALVEGAIEPAKREHVLQIIALLIARLGEAIATQEVLDWLTREPAVFDRVSAELLDVLRNRPGDLVRLLGSD